MISTRRLSINIIIDEIAALRQLSLLGLPDPVEFALAVQAAGADGVSARLNTDRSAIQDRDVAGLSAAALKSWNLYIAPSATLVDAAVALGAGRCCFVPEARRDYAAGGGLDVVGMRSSVEVACRSLHDSGVAVCANVDPVSEQIEACASLGMKGVELNCGAYALAAGERAITRRLEAIRVAAGVAKRAQMKVFARGGIDRNNMASIAAIADIDEIRVGHAFVADCVFFGIERSFARWIAALDGVDRT